MLKPILPHFTAADIVTALAVVNVVAFAAFGFDKLRSLRGHWRIRESTLLWLAFLGGTPGAYTGRAMFRHKTRKQPFCAQLHTIATLQSLALATAAYWFTTR